jgi:cell division protein FtsQ
VSARRRARPTARAAAVGAPRRGRQPAPALRWLPSTRSLLVGTGLLALAAGLYLLARESSLFAVRTIDVRGASPAVAAQVRSALEPLVGDSLVTFERQDADRRLATLADVAAASYDRDFPHTLRVFVRAERPAAVLRRGAEAWLVSERARVVRVLERPYPHLPRIWLPRDAEVDLGATLAGAPGRGARAAALVGRELGADVRHVRSTDTELTLVLGSGRELRLGDATDLALKLAIARLVLPLATDERYVDVSVPTRPVAGGDDQ